MDIGRFFFLNGRKGKIVQIDRLSAVEPQCDTGEYTVNRGEEGDFRRMPLTGGAFKNGKHIAYHLAGFIHKGETGRNSGFRFTGSHKTSKAESVFFPGHREQTGHFHSGTAFGGGGK